MYILFAGKDYEDNGGAYDIFFVGTTLKDCREKVADAIEHHSKHGDGIWWHVYDVFENKIVLEGDFG